eukprot:71789_1
MCVRIRFSVFCMMQYAVFAWDYYCTFPGCGNQNISCPSGDICNVHCDSDNGARCQHTSFIATHLVGGTFNLHSTGSDSQTIGAKVYCPLRGQCSVLCHENHQASGGCKGLTIYATNSSYLYVYAWGAYALNDVTIYCPDTFGFEEHVTSCVIDVEFNVAHKTYHKLENTQIYNIEGLNHLNISCALTDDVAESILDGCNAEGDYMSPDLHCGTNDDMSCTLASDDGKSWNCVSDSFCTSWRYPDSFVSDDPTNYPTKTPTNYLTEYTSNYPSDHQTKYPSHVDVVTNIPSVYVYVSTGVSFRELSDVDSTASTDAHVVLSYVMNACLLVLLIGMCIVVMHMRSVLLKHTGKDHAHIYSNLSTIQFNTSTSPTTPSTVSNRIIDNKKSMDPENMPELPKEHETDESDQDKDENDIRDLYDKKEDEEDQYEGRETDTLKTS